jgi:hypothetical protein
MKELIKELNSNRIVWVTPENEKILADGQLNEIFKLLKGIASKHKNENFGMMPKLQNIKLSTKEVVEAVACANFKIGNVELMGIFLYDNTEIKYEKVRGILNKHLNVLTLN